jgi:FkbM family methyltransferase
LGHDIEIKQTYAALIASDQRPTLFLDVGANYGTHSILFLAAGIPVIAFEPNPSCFVHFQTMCKLNGLSGRWEQVALGREVGDVELAYPEKETWLGSVSSDVVPNLKELHDVTSVRVPIRTLDYYLGDNCLGDIPDCRVLIKIDVEGYEREVLKGASRMLRDWMPTIIFESNDVKARDDLFHLLAGFAYCIHPLPWRPVTRSQSLGIAEFLASAATNFLALPSESDRSD